MALTSETRRWHLIQLLLMVVLGLFAVVSAAWGKVVDNSLGSPTEQVNRTPQSSDQTSRVWPKKSIAEINIDPRDPSDRKPADKSAALLESGSPLHWFNAPHAYQVFHWTAPNISYQPLYFGDVALERYGQTPWGRLDVARTAVLFYGDWLALPNNAWKMNPRSCDYPLGYVRPGSPAPATRNYLFYRH